MALVMSALSQAWQHQLSSDTPGTQKHQWINKLMAWPHLLQQCESSAP
jgi:hypothetical protein